MPTDSTTIGERFVLPRHPSWHAYPGVKQLHTVPREHLPTVTGAIQEMHLDFNLLTVPAVAKLPDGQMVDWGQKLIVREARNGFDQRVFGAAGPDWKPIQNIDLARLLEPFAERYTLDAIGSHDDGTELIVVFKIETLELNGERVDEYLLVRDSKQFGHALKFYLLPVRFKCMNQLVNGASFAVPVIHVGDVEGGIQLNLDVFRTLDVARTSLHAAYSAMGQATLTEEQVEALLLKTFPDPEVPKKVRTLHAISEAEAKAKEAGAEVEEMNPVSRAKLDEAWKYYQYYVGRTQQLREDAAEVYKTFNTEHPNLANTAWAFHMAVTELCNFRNATSDVSLAESIIGGGERAKEMIRNFDAIMEVVDPTFTAVPEYVPTSTTRRTISPTGVKAKEAREKKLASMSEEDRAAYLEREKQRVERAEARQHRAANLDPETAAVEAAEAAEKANAAAARAQVRAQMIAKRADEARAKLAAKQAADEQVAAGAAMDERIAAGAAMDERIAAGAVAQSGDGEAVEPEAAGRHRNRH